MNLPPAQKCDYIVKVAVFGAKQAGKTSILSRLCYDYFSGIYKQTIGIDFYIKNVTLAEKKIRVQFWDIQVTPKSSSNSVRQLCCKGIIGLILVYSIIDSSSFQYIKNLLTENIIKDNLGSDVLKILIANKTDLSVDSKINKELGQNLAKQNGMIFMQISAKDCSGMKQLSTRIGTQMLSIIRKHELG